MPLALGFVLGAAILIRVVDRLLERRPAASYAIILGFSLGSMAGGAVPRSLGSNASNRPMPAIGSGLGIWPLQAAPGNGVTHGGIAYPRAAIKCNIFQLFFFIIPALSQITWVPAIAFHPIHWLNNDASIRPY